MDQDALVARDDADLLPPGRACGAGTCTSGSHDMKPLTVDPKSSTSGVAGGAPRRPPPMTHRESIAEASESLMREIACTSATARRRDSIWATNRLMTRAWMPIPYCTGCCRGTGPGPCTSGIPRRGARRPRTRCRAALPIDGAVDVSAAGVAGRDRLLDDGLAQVVAHLPVRLRAVAPGTLLSVCDGGRPEFRLVRSLLQKDDDEDVEQDDEDADHGLFRHLAGRTQRLGRFELLARRPSPSPGLDGHDRREHRLALARRHLPVLRLALHQRAASEMRFHIQIMRRLEPRKQLAQPARRLRSKIAHWRSPSFSMTTTKRIGLQCQISTKTRSLLYPDIMPEPGGEQLPCFLARFLRVSVVMFSVVVHKRCGVCSASEAT